MNYHLRYFIQTFVLAVVACSLAQFEQPNCHAAEFQYPLDIATAKDGTIFLADRKLPGTWKVKDGKAAVFFQGSKKFRTPLNAVRCVIVDAEGKLISGDSSTRQVYRHADDGKPQPLLTSKTGAGIPMGMAVDSKGNLFISDLEIHRIWKVSAKGGEPEIFAEVSAPAGMTIDDKDNLWVVTRSGKKQLVQVAPDGKVTTIVAERVMQFPHHIVLGDDGTAYITDGYAKAVWKIAPGGKPEKWVSGEPLVNPVGIAKQGKDILVVDPHAKAVFSINPDGKLTKMKIEISE